MTDRRTQHRVARYRLPLTLAATLGLAAAAMGEATTGPTTLPTVVQASDQATIAASVGKEVVVEGVVSKAEWSRSGKVLNVAFDHADASKFVVVAFAKLRERLDKSFTGDAAKDFTGAKLRIRGTISKYNGKNEAQKDLLQVVIGDPSQVTIVEPAAGAATTQP